MTYKLGSLFDGSGGFLLAGALCDIMPTWASEVEPYPIAVTTSRFPCVKHLGSVTDIKGGEIEPVDIITFGSPCQDLSVAGKRAGLKHQDNGDEETTRSGLFMEAVRIIKEMREATNGMYPRFALWENVPGAFSSNKGEDFRLVCEELIKIAEPNAVMPSVPQSGWPYADSYIGDGWSLAYRVFDAQYWGVPQRRRRIHLIADFRGECAREILFEREGVRGYFAQSRAQGQGVASDAEGGFTTDDREGTGSDDGGRGLASVGLLRQLGGVEAHEELSPTLMAAAGMSGNNKPCVAYTLKIRSGCEGGGKGALIQTDKSATLATNNDQYLFQPTAYSFDSLASNSMKSKNPHSGCREVDVAKTLDTTDPNPCKNQGGIAVVQPTFIMDSIGGQSERAWEGDTAPCLKASHYKSPPVITQAAGFKAGQGSSGDIGYQDEKATTLLASASGLEPTVCVKAVSYDARGNGDGETVNTLTGDHNNRITDYSSVVVEPVVYDGANVTSPINASNPQPGDPCHTLSTDSRNLLVAPMLVSGKDVTGCLMASGYDKLGAQEMFSGDYTVIEGKPVYCLQGNGIDRADTAGCNGKGWKEDESYTLNTVDRPAVAYATDIGFFNSQEDISPTLLARMYKDPHLVTYWDGGQVTSTLTASNAGGNQRMPDKENFNCVIEQKLHYIVRRLTPTECARLQGFADRWGHPDHKTDLTDEEYEFWLKVRNTHAEINGRAVKEYTKAQMLKWYNGLHTDSAEYKMWGNGIALPPALYCMQGIVDALTKEVSDEWLL